MINCNEHCIVPKLAWIGAHAFYFLAVNIGAAMHFQYVLPYQKVP